MTVVVGVSRCRPLPTLPGNSTPRASRDSQVTPVKVYSAYSLHLKKRPHASHVTSRYRCHGRVQVCQTIREQPILMPGTSDATQQKPRPPLPAAERAELSNFHSDRLDDRVRYVPAAGAADPPEGLTFVFVCFFSSHSCQCDHSS